MCLEPLLIANPKTEKYPFYHNNRFNVDEYKRVYGKEAYIQVPCGHCEACVERRSNEWATRVYYEWLYSKNSIFFTLTYSEEFLSINPVQFCCGAHIEECELPVLVKRDAQLFMKRLRKHVGNGLRFFLGAEYGERDARPHYHVILFNYPTSLSLDELHEIIKKCWSYGKIDFQETIIQRVMYVAKYCYSCSLLPRNLIKNFVFPFILCSRRPAIGHHYYEDPQVRDYHNRTLETIVTIDDGKIMPMPRLYRTKIFSEDNKELLYQQFINDEKKPPSDDRIRTFLKRFEQKKRGKSI